MTVLSEKILSYQPFSIYGNGGGSRILRRIYAGREKQIISLFVSSNIIDIQDGSINEIGVYAFPVQKKWMRWVVRNFIYWLRESIFHKLTECRILNAVKKLEFNICHIVDHGSYSTSLCDYLIENKKEMWVSFHDHFSTSGGSLKKTKQLWNCSNRRFVISNEMGKEYCRLFGEKKFEHITDGITDQELSKPIDRIPKKITLYFAGLLHIDYYPLIQSLVDTLNILKRRDINIELILRGTQQLLFLKNAKFPIIYKPFSLDNNELKRELDAAVILYLPIKFTLPDFYMYSLSTKMIGYLGASGVILYHGPKDSAAYNLLNSSHSGICCTSINTDELLESIELCIKEATVVSGNAKHLAQNEFDLNKIKLCFWQNY